MRGSPLLRAFVAFFLIALAAIPLARLTHRAAADTTLPPQRVEEKSSSVHLEIAFTDVPSHISVLHLGKAVWESDVKESEVESDLAIPWPEEGVDLRFQITWPESARAMAARVRVTSPDGRELEQYVWSRGTADAVLTFR